jgi:hypothetical protein
MRAAGSPIRTGRVRMRLARSAFELVGVLAEQHGGRAEGVGEGDPGDLRVVVAAGDDVVGAADHQRAPHEQDGGLAEADVLERPGVEEDEEDAGGEEGERDSACLEDQVDAGREGDRAGDQRVGQDLADGHKPVLERLRAVLGAEVVVLVDALEVVGEVVEEVVGGVGEHEPDEAGEQAWPGEQAVAQREQAADASGDGGHDEDGGSRGDQPAADEVEPGPLVLADPRDHAQRPGPHAKIDHGRATLARGQAAGNRRIGPVGPVDPRPGRQSLGTIPRCPPDQSSPCCSSR